MEISLVFQEHPDDDIWEEYSFGRVGPQQLATLEQHLLACEHCQRTLARTDEYVRAMKFATAHFGDHHQARKIRPMTPAVRSWLPTAGVTGLVAAASLVLLFWTGPGRTSLTSPPAPVEVSLQSLRGGSDTINHAPARRPLDLSIAAADVPASTAYRFEVVAARGGLVWSGPAQTRDGSISARLPQSLNAGTYWVRLYGKSELLIEYGLKLE